MATFPTREINTHVQDIQRTADKLEHIAYMLEQTGNTQLADQLEIMAADIRSNGNSINYHINDWLSAEVNAANASIGQILSALLKR